MASGDTLLQLLPIDARKPQGGLGASLTDLNGYKALVFPEDNTVYAIWQAFMPAAYSNTTGITFTFVVGSSGAGNARMSIEVAAFASDSSTFNYTSANFATAHLYTLAFSATAGQVAYPTAVMAKGANGTDTDGAVAGTMIAIRISRLPANGLDTLTTDVNLFGVLVAET